jgi:hypothetical protein
VATDSFKVKKSLNIDPSAAVGASPAAGDLRIDSSDSNKPKYHNGTTEAEIPTATSTTTLTNKTLTSPVISSPTGLVKADVGLGNVDNTSDATKNAAVATLTNKTLTSPVINSPTGIVKADVGLGNVDNTSDATKNAASVTLTNKTIDATANTISNISNTEIKAAAAIALNKLAATTASKVLVSDGSGFVSPSSVTSTTLGYVDATSSIQTQLDGKQPLDSDLTAVAGLSSTGMIARTGTGSASVRTITAGSSKISMSNGDGVSGNPTIDVAEANLNMNNTGTTLAINKGGTGQITANAALNALLPSQASANNKVLKSNGTDTSWAVAGSGGGAKNYLGTINGTDNGGDFEGNTVGSWVLGTATLTSAFPSGVPTFGSGASGNLAGSIVSSGQLSGTYSYSYASSAATTAGNFLASPAFTLDISDQAKILTFKFSYKAVTNPTNANWSGTSSNSFGVAIYDVTNSAWIMPAGVWSMTQSTGVGIATGTFQTTSNSTSYRLVVFNANATSGAVTLYFDDFSLSPQTAPIGTVVTDWQATTLVAGTNLTATTTTPAFGTVATNSYKYRRNGSNLEFMIDYRQTAAGATAGTGSFLITLPNSLQIDTTLVNSNGASTSNGFGSVVGDAWLSNTATGIASQAHIGQMIVYDASRITARFKINASTADTWTSLLWGSSMGSAAFNSTNLSFYMVGSVPIAGWSTNVQMSNDTDTRVVAFSVNSTPTGTPAGSATIVNFGAAAVDTHGAWNGTTTYTVPVSGIYEVTAQISNTGTAATGKNSQLELRKNAVAFSLDSPLIDASNTRFVTKCTAIVSCVAGDTLAAYFATSQASPVFLAGVGGMSIKRLSGPSVVAATESVNARYANTAGTSVTNTLADINIPFATKDFDSHSAYNTGTGIYTVPVSGKYQVTATMNFSSQAYTAGNFVYGSVYKNSAIFSYGPVTTINSTISQLVAAPVQALVSCVAGDTLEIRAANNRTGGASTLSTTAGNNHFEIIRVGN